MKHNVVLGNPTIVKQAEDRYLVMISEPPHWRIETIADLTREELAALPFVEESVLNLLN